MTTRAERILQYHFALRPDWVLPPDIELLYPYDDPATRSAMHAFYHQYYNDDRPRGLLFGINPGRFGAGVTGVPFTDPIRLAEVCGISTDFDRKRELSSEFVYRVVEEYGGADAFYRDFYITSLLPLGFVRHGKNYNYYDSRALERAVWPQLTAHVQAQQAMMDAPDLALCLGEGQNYRAFTRLNAEQHYFRELVPLSHPRYVMQYRRRYLTDYVEQYLQALHRLAQLLVP